MRWPWLLSGLLLLVALAQQDPEPAFQTTAEIERRGKKIVVVKTGPDNPPAIIELRDLYGGVIAALDAEKKSLRVGEQEFTTDKLTRFWHEGKAVQFGDLKVGQQVRLEAAEQNDGSLKAFDIQIGGKREGPCAEPLAFRRPPAFSGANYLWRRRPGFWGHCPCGTSPRGQRLRLHDRGHRPVHRRRGPPRARA
ncbi:MAG: hypothetical protein KatS3mg074_338 [Meiothermus sp.]|nr:MAG: hypothetical protein KatS3mg074_338 [Meiothermus sp.]